MLLKRKIERRVLEQRHLDVHLSRHLVTLLHAEHGASCAMGIPSSALSQVRGRRRKL